MDNSKITLDNSFFSSQRFVEYLGAKVTQISAGYCEMELPYKDELTQQNKFYHAGVIGTIADSAAGYAAFTLMPEGSSVLSIEYKVNLLKPAKGNLLIARARVIKPGKTITVCNVDVVVVKDGAEKLCSTATVTLMALQDYDK